MAGETPTLEELTRRLIAFRDARNWRQFHSLKDLIVSLNLEAAELLELTQWKSAGDFDREAEGADMRRRLAEECADVFIYLLLIAERTGIDLPSAAADKIGPTTPNTPPTGSGAAPRNTPSFSPAGRPANTVRRRAQRHSAPARHPDGADRSGGIARPCFE